MGYRRKPPRAAWVIVIGVGSLLAVFGFFLWLPAYLGFAIAVTLAAWWCISNDTHQGRTQRSG